MLHVDYTPHLGEPHPDRNGLLYISDIGSDTLDISQFVLENCQIVSSIRTLGLDGKYWWHVAFCPIEPGRYKIRINNLDGTQLVPVIIRNYKP